MATAQQLIWNAHPGVYAARKSRLSPFAASVVVERDLVLDPMLTTWQASFWELLERRVKAHGRMMPTHDPLLRMLAHRHVAVSRDGTRIYGVGVAGYVTTHCWIGEPRTSVLPPPAPVHRLASHRADLKHIVSAGLDAEEHEVEERQTASPIPLRAARQPMKAVTTPRPKLTPAEALIALPSLPPFIEWIKANTEEVDDATVVLALKAVRLRYYEARAQMPAPHPKMPPPQINHVTINAHGIAASYHRFTTWLTGRRWLIP